MRDPAWSLLLLGDRRVVPPAEPTPRRERARQAKKGDVVGGFFLCTEASEPELWPVARMRSTFVGRDRFLHDGVGRRRTTSRVRRRLILPK